MKRLAAALGAALLLGGLTGCAVSTDEVTGTLVFKEYEGRNCEKKVGLKCKRWDPAEYELTIRQDDGAEVELVVTRDFYNRATVDTHGTWRGRID